MFGFELLFGSEVLERMTLKSPLVGFDSQISKDIEGLWTEVAGMWDY